MKCARDVPGDTVRALLEPMTPWLAGLADKLRRMLDCRLSEQEKVILLRAAAADVDLLWCYLGVCCIPAGDGAEGTR